MFSEPPLFLSSLFDSFSAFLSLFDLFSLFSRSLSLSDLSLLCLSLCDFDLDDLDFDFDLDLLECDLDRLLLEQDLLRFLGDFLFLSFDLDLERLDLDRKKNSNQFLVRVIFMNTRQVNVEKQCAYLERRDLDRERCRPRELLLLRDGELRLRSFERERLLERERDLLRCLERDRLCLDRERFLERERLLLPRDLERDFRLREPLRLRLSFDNIPIIGSMAADIKLCASFTLDMASSISFCAASLLLASGLAMACTEW